MFRSMMNAAKTMHRRFPRILFAALLLAGSGLLLAPASFHDLQAETPLAGFWIDDNLEKGLARAGTTGKPLLVVFRCPP